VVVAGFFISGLLSVFAITAATVGGVCRRRIDENPNFLARTDDFRDFPSAGRVGSCDHQHVKPTVLIVDDHASFRRSARRLLEAEGFVVVGEASDGASALSEVRALRPQLVLLDVLLPDIDGFAVAEALAREPVRPLVVLTSSREAADLATRLERAAATGFVHKSELSGAALAALIEAA
jgi:CheY-like chemotaxis protein